ncbi:hypothetical protein CLM62_21625 [Streptomyces sp. SA15]|uniref:hypothetical protein n=1 Tax=Streptomyces sp. SA15 TaxID=934019 RepID=UPI000BAF4CC9|nr:hypothetical protein [Streptomyces sp. SA15]PAZ14057.1 hypothetical protein CLM62_21625 [Streptomyces sp. SA15]
MTRSQRLAAIAVGAVLLVGIPVAGAHQAPPPDLGDPVVVGRTTGPAPAHSAVPPGGGAAEHTPARSPSPDATARPSDADEDAADLDPAPAPPDDEDTDDRTPTAKPVSPQSPVPAGVVSDDDPAPTPTAPTTSGTPSTPASDDGDDDGAGGDD